MLLPKLPKTNGCAIMAVKQARMKQDNRSMSRHSRRDKMSTKSDTMSLQVLFLEEGIARGAAAMDAGPLKQGIESSLRVLLKKSPNRGANGDSVIQSVSFGKTVW
jgi:hypothetical protein